MLTPPSASDIVARLLARIPTPPPPYTPSSTSPPTTKPTRAPTMSSPPINLTLDTGLQVLGTNNSLHMPAYTPAPATPADHARVAALLSHVLKQPDAKGRVINVKLQSGVRICGRGNAVVLGAQLREGSGNEGRTAVPKTSAAAGQEVENGEGAARKRKADEELAGAPDAKKREGGNGEA